MNVKQVLVAIVFAFAAVVGPIPFNTVTAEGPDLLYIASSLNPGQHDNALISQIESLGYQVELRADEDAPTAAEAESYPVVWISSTVNPALIGSTYKSAQVPIGTHEAFIYDDMGMATNSGQQTGQTILKRTSDNTSVSVTTQAQTFSWGAVAGDVVVSETLTNTSRAANFSYSEGALLADGTTAAQCRVGFFTGSNTANTMRPAGEAMFNAAITELFSCATPPIPNDPPTIAGIADQSNDEGDVVTIQPLASDPNDDDLAFTADNLPDGISIDPITGAIAGTITYRGADTSPYISTVTVFDTDGASASTQFTWTVIDDPTLDPPPVETPNVLVIMTDDQTVEQMRWLPSVQSFMAGGTEYTNSLTNYPLCGPSRVTMLTGQYASNHDMRCNTGLASKFRNTQEDDSLAPWLQNAGVHTIYVGKYLNGYGGQTNTRYTPTGWDDWRALAGSSAYNYTQFDMVVNGDFERYGRNGDVHYSTDVITEHLDTALRNAPSDEPFFAMFTPLAPHFQGGKDYAVPAPRHENTITDVHRPANYNSCNIRKQECATNGSDLRRGKIPTNVVSTIDNGYQTASESLKAVDESFQTIVATLTELGRLDDTVIIFTSDNGFVYGEHGIRRGKKVPARESLFVPLFISGPGFNSASQEDAPVVNADLAPTILDIFDATPTITMDGQSLLDPLSDNRAILIEAKKQSGTVGYYGVYADGWMFIDWEGASRNDLYGPSDPLMVETLDNDSEWNTVEAELDSLTDQLKSCSGVSCLVDWTQP